LQEAAAQEARLQQEGRPNIMACTDSIPSLRLVLENMPSCRMRDKAQAIPQAARLLKDKLDPSWSVAL
jgi:hypothetical protein